MSAYGGSGTNDDSALQQMSITFEQLEEMYSGGLQLSAPEVQTLTHLVCTMTPANVRPLVNLLCSRLGSPQGKGVHRRPTKEEVRHACTALMMLRDILTLIRLHCPFSITEDMVQTMVEMWPKIRSWMGHLMLDKSVKHDEIHELVISGVTLDGVISDLIVELLIVGGKPIEKTITQCRSTYRLIVKMWLKQDEDIDYAHTMQAKKWFDVCTSSVTRAILAMFELNAGRKGMKTQFVKCANGDLELIAVSVLLRIKCALRAGIAGASATLEYSHLITALSLVQKEEMPQLGKTLFEYGAVQYIIRVILKVSEWALLPNNKLLWDRDARVKDLETLFEFLIWALDDCTSASVLRQIINGGLFRALANLLSQKHSDLVASFATDMFRRYIPTQMFNIGVTRDVAQAMKRDEKLYENTAIPKQIRDYFTQLRELTIERMVYKTMYRMKNFKELKCDTCEKHRFKLKLCGRCRSTFYCSGQCQGIGWNERGHRRRCRRMPRTIVSDITKRPTAAQSNLSIATYDFDNSLPGIYKIARRKYPGKKLDDLLVYADYTQGLVSYEVFSHKDIKKKVPGHPPVSYEAGACQLMAMICKGQDHRLCGMKMDLKGMTRTRSEPPHSGPPLTRMKRSKKMDNITGQELELSPWDDVDYCWSYIQTLCESGDSVWDEIASGHVTVLNILEEGELNREKETRLKDNNQVES